MKSLIQQCFRCAGLSQAHVTALALLIQFLHCHSSIGARLPEIGVNLVKTSQDKAPLADFVQPSKPFVVTLRCLAVGSVSHPDATCDSPVFQMASAHANSYSNGEIIRSTPDGENTSRKRRGADINFMSLRDVADMEAFWKSCRAARIVAPGGGSCCPPGENCLGRVIEVAKVGGQNGELLGIAMPYDEAGAAQLLPFIAQERYNASRFSYSAASRFEPRETPILAACNSWVDRLRAIILRRRLPLLMRWGPDGYFDIFRKFDSTKQYGPSLQAPILSVLLNRLVKDEEVAAKIWDEWIRGDILHNGYANEFDNDSQDSDGHANETQKRSWWSNELMEFMTQAYGAFQELQDEVEVLQHSVMERSVHARSKDVFVRTVQTTSVIALGGVAIAVATGGIAAATPGGAIATLGWSHPSATGALEGLATGANLAWLGAVRPWVIATKHHNADTQRNVADSFGQSHKILQWIQVHLEWINRWVEFDLAESLLVPQPHLKLRKEVEQLFCNTSGSSGNCPEAEEHFMATLLASWINMVMIDGGCRTDSDFMSFSGAPAAAFGTSDTAACCAQEEKEQGGLLALFTTPKDKCMVENLLWAPAKGCPHGWRRVTQEWAFLSSEDTWETDRRDRVTDLEQQTCCGILATAPHGEFQCGAPRCASTHIATSKDSTAVVADPPNSRSRLEHWRQEAEIRSAYCKLKTKNRKHCNDARAFALYKGRRAFCTFYATRKHNYWSTQRSIETCLDDVLQQLQQLQLQQQQQQQQQQPQQLAVGAGRQHQQQQQQ